MILALLLGTLYGLIIGLIPAAGATTGLIILFGLMSFKQFKQKLLIASFNRFID